MKWRDSQQQKMETVQTSKEPTEGNRSSEDQNSNEKLSDEPNFAEIYPDTAKVSPEIR